MEKTKAMALIIAAIPATLGLIEIGERIASHFESPHLVIHRISINGHYLSYTPENLVGSLKRFKQHENKALKSPSAQTSISIYNPQNEKLEIKGLSLYIEPISTPKSVLLGTYLILTKNLNISEQFNSSLTIPPNSTVDLEVDFIAPKDRKETFGNCAVRFAIAFTDQNHKIHTTESKFEKPTCKFSRKSITVPALSSPIPTDFRLIGREHGYNPFLIK